MMDFDFDGSMFESLAELLDVDIRVIDLLNPTIGEDCGSSNEEWHYGFYFEIPAFEDLDEAIQEEIQELVDIDSFPFGETIYLSDGQLSDTKADPLGWRADYEEDQYYQKCLFPMDQVLTELTDIAEIISSSESPLIVKSLLFSAFSLTESYLRSFIWVNIPDVATTVSDEKMRVYLNERLSKELRTARGREDTYLRFTGKKLRQIPNMNPFRNSLAHDIGSGVVTDGNLTIRDAKGHYHTESIDTIINQLKEYISELK